MEQYAELVELIGLDDSEWRSAKQLQDLLSMLNQQRELDIDAELGDYVFAARSMYRYAFGRASGLSYDAKRKCLWQLGEKVGSCANDTSVKC